MRLIDEEGKQVGVVTTREALWLAKDRGYDLVEVAPDAKPPVCRVLDYGKYRYQMSKKHTAKKTTALKEVKVRLKITDHDLQLKVKNIKKFLDNGDKAKVSMFFRGREIVKPEIGMKVFERITGLLDEGVNIEHKPKLEGRSIIMVIAPLSRKN
ncbi:translation initiation factor IF-3 [Thermodesulfovibrionales bacterium]|nr:translation initiation factor IF-3 [Thermodesulfovibrionales bacterium]